MILRAHKYTPSLPLAILAVLAMNIYVSMECCTIEGVHDYTAQLIQVLHLSLGPFAWWYFIFIDEFDYMNAIGFIVANIILVIPWLIYYQTKGYLSLMLGSVLWFLSAFMYVIGVWI